MDKRIIAAQDRVKKAEQALRGTIFRTVLLCKHKLVADDYGSPPMRICLNCGLTDEGWGCGYQVLTNDDKFVGRISHSELLRLRTVSIWQCNYGKPVSDQIAAFPF